MFRLTRPTLPAWLHLPALTPLNFLLALTLAMGFALVAVVMIRTNDLVRIEHALDAVRDETAKAQSELLRNNEDILNRLSQLEKEIYGTSPPQVVIIDSGPATWQRNRDRDLRRRIAALEAFRLAHEGRHDD